MLNDHRYFMLLGDLSVKAQKIYPEEIYPFSYEDIDLFTHEYDHKWRVTEFKTGCKMGEGSTPEDARLDAEANINTIGISQVKNNILITLSRIFEGFEYINQEWVKS